MAPTAECVVSADKGIRISWSCTDDGGINILIRPDPRGGIETSEGLHRNCAWKHLQQTGTDSSTITFQHLSQSEVDEGLRTAIGQNLAQSLVGEENDPHLT